MSLTFSILCRETNKYLWIGQGHCGEMTNFYTGEPATMERLRRFLNEHKGKHLEFICNDHDEKYGNYDEFRPDLDGKSVKELEKLADRDFHRMQRKMEARLAALAAARRRLKSKSFKP